MMHDATHIKTPSLTVYLKPEFAKPDVLATQAQQELAYTSSVNVITAVEIRYVVRPFEFGFALITLEAIGVWVRTHHDSPSEDSAFVESFIDIADEGHPGSKHRHGCFVRSSIIRR